MASISIAGRRVGQEIPTGAGHLALFYTTDGGAELILSAYTDSTLLSGDLYIETYEGSAWVPRAFSTENTLRPDIFDTVLLDFGGRIQLTSSTCAGLADFLVHGTGVISAPCAE